MRDSLPRLSVRRTCLNCLYRTLLTGSDGFTFPASTVDSILPRVTMPKISPDSSTTGAWSKAFSFRIRMVFWQVTVGSTVRGADRFRPCTFWFHHQGLETMMSSSLRKPF
uniref:Uncharacterized protein n=1 Tax=Anguilla anguilla TaxID=7936 RepID=A0A0E9XTZ5_ANGAN